MGRYEDFVAAWGSNEELCALELQLWIYTIYQPKSVIDIGCGAGVFLTDLQRRGVEVLGVDLEQLAYHQLGSDSFLTADLTKPLTLKKKYDLCLCLEVIEHIEKQYEQTVIKNCTTASDVVIFSGAKPNQIGENHINCNTKEYWVSLFSKEGFVVDVRHTNLLYKSVLEGKTFDAAPWLRENIVIFYKEGK